MMIIKSNFFLLTFFSILTIAVYYPGLADGFYFDDHINIVDNTLLHVENPTLGNFWQAAWSGNSGRLGRPLSYFSFSVNWFFTGNNAVAMKLTNLVIHILAGILLFFLSKKLLTYINRSNETKTNVNLIAALIYGIWILHPINLTGVLYVVQRMTSLSALFCVSAMLCYAHFRLKQIEHKSYWFPLVSSTGIFTLLAVFTKETAVNLVFYLALIEIFVFKFSAFRKADQTILKTCFTLGFIIIAISIGIFLIANPEWLEVRFDRRSFTLTERLLTESRVVVWYLKMIIAPNISEMSLFLDDFSLSKSLFQPFTTLISIALILLILVLGFISRKIFLLVAFGIFWFFSAHLLESTILPLELAYEHRNYLPSFGIFICLISLFQYLLSREKIRYVISICLVIWISLISYTTFLRAQQWSDPLNLALADVEHHPNSARAHVSLAGIYVGIYAGFHAGIVSSKDGLDADDIFHKADYHFKKSAQLDPFFSSANVARLILYSSFDKELPREDYSKIVSTLQEKKLDSSTVTALRKLSHCHIKRVCKLSTEDFMGVMYAPLLRQDIDKHNLALLLVFLSEYYVAVLNDLDTAIQLTKIAIEEQPKDIHYRFVLIRWLTTAKLYQDALDELEIIRAKDRFGMFTSNADAWKIRIDTTAEQNT